MLHNRVKCLSHKIDTKMHAVVFCQGNCKTKYTKNDPIVESMKYNTPKTVCERNNRKIVLPLKCGT